ncbi:MAG: hypothetical protein HY062_02385 [Bacteroidetes bacterium]|nr:hypothetical protein [Bacteroidota bacterium]
MNKSFWLSFRVWIAFLLLFTGIQHSYAQSDSSKTSGICKQLAIQSAQSADISYSYAQRNYFETRQSIIGQNIDTALIFIKESISYLDSAILLASDSAIKAKEHANIARDLSIDSYNTLALLKSSDFSRRKELSKKAALFSADATVEAYHASFYFTDQKKPEKKEEKEEKEEKTDSITPQKQITKLDIDQTLFTLLKGDLTEKSEINQQEIAKLKAELETTKNEEKAAKLKGQLRILEAKTKELAKKSNDVQSKLSSITTLIEERDKTAATAPIQKDTIFSKSTLKTMAEWNENVKSDNDIPMSLVYQVQLGVFKTAVLPETFKGLTPIYSKTTDKGVCYTTGLFERLSDAREAKNTVQSMGLTDAFIVAYYNKKKITLAEAAKLEKK